MIRVINHDYFCYSLALVLGSILVFLPPISKVFPDFDGVIPVFTNSVACSLLLISWLLRTRIKNVLLQVNKVDACFILYLCYGILKMIIHPCHFDPLIVCEWFGLVIIYVLARLLDTKVLDVLKVSLILGGTIQAFIGILQYFNLFASNNTFFKVTGNFANPGHLGGFLALSVIVSLLTWQEKGFSFKGKNILLPSALLLQIFVLLASNSRAAWLAVIIPIFFLLTKKYSAFYRGWVMKLSSLVLVLALCTGLYYYKKASADVRVLTWKSSLLMIRDAPVFGHGIGSFAANYMPYQARYLEGYPDNFSLIADNNLIAFNEFIHLTCEQGMVGLLLFICLLALAFANATKVKYKLTFYFALMGLLVFALFSYPASIFPIKICFPLFTGILARDREALVRFHLKNWQTISITMIIILGAMFNIKTYLSYSQAYHSLNNGDYLQENFNDYSAMKHDKNFLYLLGEQYLRHNLFEESIEVKKRLAEIAPTSALLCDLGMLYLHKNEPDSALDCFLHAQAMTPNHVQPIYGLWLVAKVRDEKEKRVKLSIEIITKPVRVVNSVVLKARKEAKEYLKEQGINF